MKLSETDTKDLLDELVLRMVITPDDAIDFLFPEKKEQKFKEKAIKWITIHPEWFQAMTKEALSLSQKNEQFSIRIISEAARYANNGNPIHITNAYVKYVKEIMTEQNPSLKDLLK